VAAGLLQQTVVKAAGIQLLQLRNRFVAKPRPSLRQENNTMAQRMRITIGAPVTGADFFPRDDVIAALERGLEVEHILFRAPRGSIPNMDMNGSMNRGRSTPC
jgi:hypothetical protein